MTHCGLRLLFFLAIAGVPLGGHAQETLSYARPHVPLPDPVYVLNSTIIINGLLAEFSATDIEKVTVYHGGDPSGAPEAAPPLQHLGVGVLDLTSRRRVRSHSFAQLGRRLGLRGPLTFALNGHPLDAPAVAALRIAPAAIGQLHIVRPTPQVPTTRVDVWLVSPPKADQSAHPPGSIFIR